jgi:hypothetical protein
MNHQISRNLANLDVTNSDLETGTGYLNCLPSYHQAIRGYRRTLALVARPVSPNCAEAKQIKFCFYSVRIGQLVC